jgi:hypothetical protein
LRTLSVVILSALSPLSLSAQTTHPLVTAAPRITRTPATSASAGTSTQLPVTRVSLYKNGVGFFEHAGRVTGNQSITIDFTSAQLNDVLQSLTAVDLNGGRISGAAYNSITPLEQQLKALPLALDEDPTAVDLYNAIRGARVEVTGSGTPITGRLLNIELVNTPASDTKPATEKRLLTVMSESGSVRTLELTSATNVRLLDPALQADVNRYLQLLANNRSQGLRHLTLQDNGNGARDLRVSYISEVPVWKSTYRILFTDLPGSTNKQTATLQGWSVVDNTTGSDWLNVQLSLIAGSPQSFIQPLSQPIYSRRPEVAIAQEAQLTPQTFASGDEFVPKDMKMMQQNGSPQAMAGVAGMGSGGGFAGGVMAGLGNAPSPRSANQTVSVSAAPMIAYEEVAADSIASQTTTNSFDDYFEYKITEPVTIRKNESALVPILQTKITSERVTLWSPQRTTPLRALWITNTSNLTIDRGSFSIVENGSFGGEGLLDPIYPNERRLLSYAADQAIRVTPANTNNTHTVQHVTVAKGVLTQRSLDINQVDYLVHNAAPDARTVIIEHPVRNGWDLDSTSSNPSPKPDETTSAAYRFRVEAASGKTATLHLRETHAGTQFIYLTNTTEDQLTLILRNANATPALRQQFEPVFAARRTLTDLDRQIQSKQSQVNTITQDQNRLRENMKALKGSAEERALTTRYTTELNQQEDNLATLHKDLDTLNQQHQAATEDLSNKIQSLNFDADI